MASSSEEQPTVCVDVWSSPACPWCWVGHRRLSQAVADLGQDAQFDLRWHAFCLAPAFPDQGEPVESYYNRRFGAERGAALRQRLHDAGKWDGAPFADWQWRPDEMKANKLVALAGKYGKSHQANELLFRKTYEEGANMSDRMILDDVARQLDLPGGELESWLESAEAADEVERDLHEAQRRHISGVPTFSIRVGGAKPVTLVGAESVRAFEVAFRKVLHDAGYITGTGA